MGNIVLDDNKITFNVLPNLSNAKNTIQEAYNACKSLSNSLPGSFPGRSMVSNLAIKISLAGKDVDTARNKIDLKMDYVKRIESKSFSKVSSLSSTASKLGTSLGMVAGAIVGSTSGIVGTAIGTTTGGILGNVVSSAISKLAKTGANIVKSTISGVKKVITNVGDAINNVSSKIAKKTKSFVSKIKDTSKSVISWLENKIGSAASWVGKTLKNTGAAIAKTAKAAVSWVVGIGKNVFKHITKTGASIVNSIVSMTKGLIKLVESMGDLVVLLGSGVGSSLTVLADVTKGLATGKFEWNATKKLWDTTKAIVSYDVTNEKIFKPLYSSKVGQVLDEYAYKPFKSTGVGVKIIEGVGYAGGIIAVSCLTLGTGSVAFTAPQAAKMTITAGATGLSKYTEGEWNKNSISFKYGENNLKLSINYKEYSEIEKLKDGELTTLTKYFSDGNGNPVEKKFTIIKNGSDYLVSDSDGNISKVDSLNESNTAKGLLIGGIKGAWEGAQYFVGSKIGMAQFDKVTGAISNPLQQQLAKSGMRVGLDMLTGVAEVPFQSAIMVISDNTSWENAWNANGGWKAVKAQAGIAGIMSLVSEGISLKNTINDNVIINNDIKNNEIVNKMNDVYKNKNLEESVHILISKEKGKNGKVAGVELFNKLGNDHTPTLVGMEEFIAKGNSSKYGVIYRGISGENAPTFVEQFKSGDLYVGGDNAAIYGTGIYTGYGERGFNEIATSYKNAGGHAKPGEIMPMILAEDAKIIEFDDLVLDQQVTRDEMARQFAKYDSSIVDIYSLENNLSKITNPSDLKAAQYLVTTLNDYGYYAAVRGYDAIDIVKKNYLNVLNRGKLIMVKN